MIKTLLIPLDGSVAAERALPYAVRLARATRSRLLLMQARGDLALLTRMEAEFGIVVRLEPHLDALRRSGGDTTPGLTVRSLSSSEILRVAREDHVDLVVMSIQGHVYDEVLRRAGVPVLLVSPVCDRQWQEDRPVRLLVPLDGSLHAESALAPARELAETMCADLLLVRAIRDPTRGSHRFSDEGVRIRLPEGEYDLNEARQYLALIAGKQDSAFRSIERLADIGEAARVIADAARQEDIDLIVMATHGRTGLARLTMGSVARQVLQRAHTPILLVRPATLSHQEAARLEVPVH